MMRGILQRPRVPGAALRCNLPFRNALRSSSLTARTTPRQRDAVLDVSTPENATPSPTVPPDAAVPPRHERSKPEAWYAILRQKCHQQLSSGDRRHRDPSLLVEIVQKALENRQAKPINLVQYVLLEKGDHRLAARIMKDAFLVFKEYDKQQAIPWGLSLKSDIPRAPAAPMEQIFEKIGEGAEQELSDLVQWTSSRYPDEGLFQTLHGMSADETADAVQRRKLAGTFLWATGSLLTEASRMKDLAQRERVLDFLREHMNRLWSCEHVVGNVLQTYKTGGSCASVASLPLVDIASLSAAFTSMPDQNSLIENMVEFLIWCCIHGGHHTEAEELIFRLGVGGDRPRWDLTSHPRRLKREYRTRTLWLSKNVVTVLIEASLTNLNHPEYMDRNHRWVVHRVQRLYSLLRRRKLRMDNMSSDAFVGLMADLPGFDLHSDHTIACDTITMSNRAVRSDDVVETVSSSYISEHSAAPLTIFHRRLALQIQARDVRGAIKTLGELQTFTSYYQERSVNSFFDEIEYYNSLSRKWQNRMDLKDKFAGTPPTNAHLAIPNVLLSSLLDLVTDAGEAEIGHWMVHGGDNAEGPIIKPSMYLDEQVAASLVRYAAVAQDKQLLSSVLQTLDVNVSGNTLVALCESRFQSGQFQEAVKILGVIREYAIHSWKIRDAVRLVKALFAHLHKDVDAMDRGTAHAMLLKLLRGDLGIVADLGQQQLADIAEVVADADEELRKNLSNVLTARTKARSSVETEHFDILLQGIVQAFGSARGQAVYKKWCQEDFDAELDPQTQGEGAKQKRGRRPIAHMFGYTPTPDANQTISLGAPSRTGKPRIEPSLATIRVIIGRAIKEYQEPSKASTLTTTFTVHSHNELPPPSSHPVLSWAADVLSQDFRLADADIDWELQGYVTVVLRANSSLSVPDLYSTRTLTLWRAVAGTNRRSWALDTELELRRFTQNPMQQQMTVGPLAASERALVHALCQEFRLQSRAARGAGTESTGDVNEDLEVLVQKPEDWYFGQAAYLPETRVDDAAQAWFQRPQGLRTMRPLLDQGRSDADY